MENTLQKYKDYIENRWSDVQRNRRDFRKPLRKTKIPYYRYEGEGEGYLTEDEAYDDEGEYYTCEGISKPKRKKRIVYVDEIDGNENDEGDEHEEVVEEVEEPEVVTRVVKRTAPAKKKINKNVKKVGITRSI